VRGMSGRAWVEVVRRKGVAKRSVFQLGYRGLQSGFRGIVVLYLYRPRRGVAAAQGQARR
jgi:hypothetical protein